MTKNIVSFCLILTPIVCFWYIFQKYAINIPHWDDFAVRNSLANFIITTSFGEKINILFAQHNEHRIFLTRFAALLIYEIKGTLDVKWLMFIGNFSLVGILFLFFKLSKKYNFTILSLAPVSFLIFNAGLYENSFWGMASIQNFGVIFLAFISFYWLVFSIENHANKYFYWAIFSCFLGVFTSSNGIIIPLIGVLILLLQGRKQAVLIWVCCSSAFLISYFYNFKKNPQPGTKADLSNPVQLLKGFVATIGSAIDSTFILPEKHINLSLALGIALIIFIAVFAYQTIFKKYQIEKKNNAFFLLACLAFLTITCVGIVYARISFGFGTLLSSKYKIYSILILSIFYLVILQSFSEKRKHHFIIFAIFVTIIYNFYTYIADYQSIRFVRHERVTDQFKQQFSDKDIPTVGIVAQLQQPVKIFYEDIIDKISNPIDSVKTNIHITENETNFRLEESQNGKKTDLTSADAGLYLILKSTKKIYLFPTQTISVNRKVYLEQEFLMKNRLPISSFATEITKFYIESGSYRVGKLLVENETKTVIFTNQTIDIQSVTKEKPQQNW